MEIYVLMSFKILPNGNIETGKRMFFFTLEKALDYLNHAGKRVPGEEKTFYDEPSEYRWDHVVIEKVPEGPMVIAKVVSCWKATFYKDNKEMILSYEEIEQPKEFEGTFNITGIG